MHILLLDIVFLLQFFVVSFCFGIGDLYLSELLLQLLNLHFCLNLALISGKTLLSFSLLADAQFLYDLFEGVHFLILLLDLLLFRVELII